MSWLAGYVKEVQSGDTVVIASANRLPSGMLAGKRLNLSSLNAPRMVRVTAFPSMRSESLPVHSNGKRQNTMSESGVSCSRACCSRYTLGHRQHKFSDSSCALVTLFACV
jgi:hypothetical protein